MENRDLYHAIHGIRMLLFLETEPQSNKYRQILLSPEEFKRVAFAYGKLTGKKLSDGLDEVKIEMSDEIFDLPDLQELAPDS